MLNCTEFTLVITCECKYHAIQMEISNGKEYCIYLEEFLD